MTSKEFKEGLEKIGGKLIYLRDMHFEIHLNKAISKYIYFQDQNSIFLSEGNMVQTIKLDDCKLYINEDYIEIHNPTVYINIFNI